MASLDLIEAMGSAQRQAARTWTLLQRFPGHLRERDFWLVQAGVLLITAAHLLSEAALDNSFLGVDSGLHHIPILLYALPIAYGSVRYGWEGGVLTSGWITILALPNTLLWHRENFMWLGELAVAAVVIAVGVALSSRVAMEARLRRWAEASEAKFRALFEAAGDAILVYDAHGSILAANPAAARLLGAPDAGALLGLDLGLLIPTWGDWQAGRRPSGKREPYGPVRVTVRRRDRGELAAEAVVAALPDGIGEEAFQVVLRDRTVQEMRERGLRSLLQQVTRAQEEERERIAHELHDETLQALILLAREQESLAGVPEMPKATRERQKELAKLARSTAEALRRFSRDLRPSVLRDLGLVPALEWLVQDLSRHAGLEARLSVEGAPRRLPSDVELALFRVAQEVLRNAAKHARASRVELVARFETSRVALEVTDDGVGFEMPLGFHELLQAGKLGLVGIRERVSLIGGSLEVHAAPDQGTRVSLVVSA